MPDARGRVAPGAEVKARHEAVVRLHDVVPDIVPKDRAAVGEAVHCHLAADRTEDGDLAFSLAGDWKDYELWFAWRPEGDFRARVTTDPAVRAVLVCDGGVVHAHHLPPTLQTAEASGTMVQTSLADAVEQYEKDMIVDALKSARGNRAKAARLLGTTERIMGYKVRKYGIDPGRFRGTCYRAANWIYVGQTQGRGRMDRTHQAQGSPKDILLYPLESHWRQDLCHLPAPQAGHASTGEVP